MDVKVETQKRLDIARSIAKPLEGIVQAVVISGSVGFGANFSVTDKSDIDLVVVCDKENLSELEATEYFKGHIPEGLLKSLGNELDDVWVTRNIDGVEVNAFVYETSAYQEYASLKKDLIVFIVKEPSKVKEEYLFDGTKTSYDKKIKPFGNIGYAYIRPALLKGHFWLAPTLSDFVLPPKILYQKDGFFNTVRESFWQAAIKQLVKEHGPNVDLDKYNLLNCSVVYQERRHKLPQSIIDDITEETARRIKDYK